MPSTRPGNFATTNAVFNPKTDNEVLDPLIIPSLRGARFLAPYGHDGRTASLRDFVRNVIVNEFAGPAPSNTAWFHRIRNQVNAGSIPPSNYRKFDPQALIERIKHSDVCAESPH